MTIFVVCNFYNNNKRFQIHPKTKSFLRKSIIFINCNTKCHIYCGLDLTKIDD